jgi:hypothetical protein
MDMDRYMDRDKNRDRDGDRERDRDKETYPFQREKRMHTYLKIKLGGVSDPSKQISAGYETSELISTGYKTPLNKFPRGLILL